MARSDRPAAESVDGEFEELLEFLRDNRGLDFTGYKRASLGRRLARRMAQVEVTSFPEYIDYLQLHPDEYTALFNTILINVTGFFRDADAWSHLRTEILPEIITSREPRQPVRAWSAGTASGAEAYSMAMLLAEALGPDGFRERAKIYATDIDEDALNQARQGVYTEREISGVPADLRDKYFDRVNGSYAVHKDLRRSVIFGRNDLIQDAPISHVDLLVCRNTLMYFNAETQDRILHRFHYAVTEQGVLFLGKAETMLTRSWLFAPVDLRRRFFRKLPYADDVRLSVRQRTPPTLSVPNADRLTLRALDTAPDATMVVDAEMVLVYHNPKARQLLGLTERDVGRPLRELDASLRPVEVMPLVDRASREGTGVTVSDVEHRAGDEIRYVDVTVEVIPGDDGPAGACVFYSDVTATHRLAAHLGYANRQLEKSFEELQSTVEELETTNEELQSTVEELETTNEELQSTVEELETTNEELQSTNDELQSANDEISERTAEVAEAISFMDAILRGLDSAVVVVDLDLDVTAWSERADDLWGVRPNEAVGQHLLNLDIGLSLDALQPPVRRVLSGQSAREELTLDATNRRGHGIRTSIRCVPLVDAAGARRGAILFMEPVAN